MLSPFLVALSALALASQTCSGSSSAALAADAPAAAGAPGAASVVIPNWNGRDLLEKYLPSVVEALAGNPDNEIVVVDNGSTDGSADFVRAAFPQVNLLALPREPRFRRRLERRLPRGEERLSSSC